MHIRGYGLACLRDDTVQFLHLQLERLVDALRFVNGELLALHQLVDVQAIASGGRDPAGRGMGLLQIAQLHQIRQLVADGGGGDLRAHLGGDGLGANRLRGADVVLDHDLQYLFLSACQFHRAPRILRLRLV